MRRSRQDWPDAVIFDLDGTLIDSAPDIAAALNKALDAQSLAPFTLNQVKEMIGGGVPKLVERALITRGASPIDVAPTVAHFIAAYQNDIVTQTVVYEGGYDVLERFVSEDRRLGLCTNKRQDLTIDILQKLDLANYFAAVVGERNGQPHKPDPTPLRNAMIALGSEPGRTVMVGDSSADVGCARAAGVKCVVVDYGYSTLPVEKLGADRVISRLQDLPDALIGLS